MPDAKSLWRKLKKRSVDGIRNLVLAIAQDSKTGEVLMAAFMNRQAFVKTLETGLVHYYSTSRRRMWLKGESSGNLQHVRRVYLDCDMDAVLLEVKQDGGACHTGYRSCFYRRLGKRGLEVSGRRVFNPDIVYGK